ncbi:efflux RND transporter periplasmic adaptor subunit [Galbibacter pacificus]|uniref:Efflux RND transporter periplasmic adaptor subunit n=1 Tax=Galbibacter pacificus TaxID=2996052 RepID=A0ABT6FRF9_9FLAO|nr:efflux RND transporter periplasmic adaptor subunit [Galbibacter pacificus]MDG3581706.1 efflux RND transporter periplasmic adaptor subunit [Galbibacter pacificus]MDG3585820.1 efflux RND transporter periplasmic adaptor subunit [Galbibacter pacificus]
MKKKRKVMQIMFGVPLLAIIAFTLHSCSDSKAAGHGNMALLETPFVHPIQDSVGNWDEYIGRFAASERVEVRSRVNGYIESVNFKDGDIVKKGQVLFVIDQRPFYIELKQAEAEKLRAEADLNRTTSDYNRIESVKDSRAVSMEEVEQRKQIAKSAEAQLMAANARLEQARLNLSYTEVKAPISGKISDDFIDAGNYVTGGIANATPLTTIVKIAPIHFYFEGSEKDFINQNSVSNTPVTVKLSTEDKYSRTGVMDFVDNEINRNTGTIRGRAVFDNADLKIESGMFGRLRLIKGNSSAILIPEEAISTNQSDKVVYVIAEDSTVHVKPVKLGKLYKMKYRIVKEGLTPDDRIVTGNLLKVRPGMKVAPSEDKSKVQQDSTSVAYK